MKHAIILAHPAASSLNASIARLYAEAVEKLGGEVITRNLYQLGFDPCLKAEEIPGPTLPKFGDDVQRERALLADVDVFVLVYPLWFNAPPAILKGYIDRVFGMGFGFEPRSGGNDPCLTGRRLISFTTSGAPEDWVRETGALGALLTLFDAHLCGTCGFTLVDHVHFGGVVTGFTSEAYQDVVDQVRSAVKTNFAGLERNLAPGKR